MKAVRFQGQNSVAVVDCRKPEAKKGISVVKVLLSGICGTDIEILSGLTGNFGVIPGHEIMGLIDEAAPDSSFQKGDRVIVDMHAACGKCHHCQSGDVALCDGMRALGHQINGGFAEFVAVPESSLILLPPDISDEMGALITDPLGTSFHAIHRLGIRRDDVVAVFGLGAVGQLAVSLIRSLEAIPIAVDLNEKRLEFSRIFGAEILMNPGRADVKSEISRITGGRGLDKAVQCTSSGRSVDLSLQCLGKKGRLCQVGCCPDLSLGNYGTLMLNEIEIIGSRFFNRNELPQIFEYARKNPGLTAVVTHKFGLADFLSAIRAAMSGLGVKIFISP